MPLRLALHSPLPSPPLPPQVRTNYTVGPGTKVIRSGAPEDTAEEERALEAFTGEQLNLLPLVNIQHSIAQSIELAHRACVHSPEDADDIKRSAILCRSQLIYTIKLLKKIERTATSVLDMFPDLELAVEDGEPALAHSFFTTVKDWVVRPHMHITTFTSAHFHLSTPPSLPHQLSSPARDCIRSSSSSSSSACLSPGRAPPHRLRGAAPQPREHDQAAQDPGPRRAGLDGREPPLRVSPPRLRLHALHPLPPPGPRLRRLQRQQLGAQRGGQWRGLRGLRLDQHAAQ